MVTISSGSGSFDIRQINFISVIHGIPDKHTGTHFKTAPDEFNGHGFRYKSYTDPTTGSFVSIPSAGTVTEYYNSFFHMTITGLDVAVTDFVTAAKTASLSDNRRLIEEMLNGRDTYEGGRGDSYMATFAGNDTLIGGGGQDVLFGGAGADTFVFKKISDSTTSRYDALMDFSIADHDKIDLSVLNAGLKAKGDATLHFIGTHALDHHAGELHVFYANNNTFVGADIDGDGKDDFGIGIAGTVHLTQHAFVL